MLGVSSLLAFSMRAMALVLIVSMLWIFLAQFYDSTLVYLANFVVSDAILVKSLGWHIIVEPQGQPAPYAISSFTLHYGLILMAVVVLAAVGIGALQRIRWLLILASGSFVAHVAGVALLAYGASWAGDGESSQRLLFSAFAVFWGLLPAVAGGAWCFAYWRPKMVKHEL